MPKVSFDFNLAPTEAINYLKNKGFKLTFDHDELIKEAHHKAFTVAKVTRLDLLNDIHTALNKSLDKGIPFKEFQKSLKSTLQKKGWWGTQDITNPKTGEIKTIDIGSRRLKNIYDTNMRVAYTKARYDQQMADPINVYLRYVSELKPTTRVSHANMHGIIKHRDDIWWNKNHPLNGWGCKCKVVAMSKKIIEKRGYKIDTSTKTQNIAEKDWDYHIGKTGSKVGSLNKIDLDTSLDNLPKVTKNTNYDKLTNVALLETFYTNLGVNKGDVHIDKVGDPMIIDDSLFSDSQGRLKIKKKDRHLLLDYLPEAIIDPDEIYLEFEKSMNRLVKKMFKYITINGKKRALMSIFEYNKDKTQGVTLYLLDTDSTVEKKRVEKLIYKRESE